MHNIYTETSEISPLVVAVKAFRFCLHCVPFQRHPCRGNQPKALAKVITGNIRENRMARPLEGSTLYAEEETLLQGYVEGRCMEWLVMTYALSKELILVY
jgi:hypothetical protein